MQSESGAYSRLWHDINRELWRSACAGVPPRGFIRAELWRRVDHTRLLEKSAAIRMARKNKAPGPVFRACNWLVETGPVSASHEMPEQSAILRMRRFPNPGRPVIPASIRVFLCQGQTMPGSIIIRHLSMPLFMRLRRHRISRSTRRHSNLASTSRDIAGLCRALTMSRLKKLPSISIIFAHLQRSGMRYFWPL